jgi:hypothetical protein
MVRRQSASVRPVTGPRGTSHTAFDTSTSRWPNSRRARATAVGGRLFGDVGEERRHAGAACAQRRRHRFERGGGDVDADQGRALGGEASADRRPDVAARAGHDRHLALQTHCSLPRAARLTIRTTPSRGKIACP